MVQGSMWRRRDRRKFSFNDVKNPRAYRPGRAESYPVQGELCLRATSLLTICRDHTLEPRVVSIDFTCWLSVMDFITAASGTALPFATAASRSNSSGV